jgi:hypothetical protein
MGINVILELALCFLSSQSKIFILIRLLLTLSSTVESSLIYCLLTQGESKFSHATHRFKGQRDDSMYK